MPRHLSSGGPFSQERNQQLSQQRTGNSVQGSGQIMTSAVKQSQPTRKNKTSI